MERTAIAEAIVQHLARHPRAKDSARGVVEWCRAALGVSPPQVLVEDVLEELVGQGRVQTSILVDGTRIYYAP